MNWFTVFVEKPSPELAAKCVVNCAGQHIAFDGKASGAEMLALAQIMEKDCNKVQVFKGKTLGKLIAEVVNCKLQKADFSKAEL